MLLILIAVALILGIAFFQALQGLFSSLVMAVLTLACTLIAFNYYEPLAALVYDKQPATAEAVALMALLIVPLLILRTLSDRFLGVNVVPEPWVDRIGGGVFGLLTSMWLVGTLLIAIQMLPFNRSYLGYDAYTDNLEKNSLWIDAPAFTLGTVKVLSGGSMAMIGQPRPYGDVHDDLMLELWGTRNRPVGARMEAPANSLTVQGAWDGAGQFSTAPEYPGQGAAPSQVVVVRVTVTQAAADADGFWRLPGTQFRLVMQDGASFFPVGYLSHTGAWRMHTDEPGKVFIGRPRDAARSSGLPIDLLYRIPYASGQAEPRKPAYMAFRRSVRVAVPEVQQGLPGSENTLSRPAVRGRTSLTMSGTTGLFYRPEHAQVGANLPAGFKTTSPNGEVTTAGGVEATVQNGLMARGRITDANEANIRIGQGQDVYSFQVPSGFKMVQLPGRPQERGVLQTPALMTLMQPRVVYRTSDGQTYQLSAVGGWTKWSQQGRAGLSGNFIHLFYNPDLRNSQGAMLDSGLVTAYRSNADTATQFGLLFLVPSGSEVLGFHLAGGSGMIACDNPMSVD